MPLIVEDGTNVANADSFVTLVEFRAWLTAFGGTAGTDTADEAAIRRATAWLSTYFRWKGSRTNGRSQVLSHPRTGATDCEGSTIASNDIPVELKTASCIASKFEQTTPFGLTPAITPTQIASRERVEGAVDVTYRDPEYKGLDQIDSARPVLAEVEDVLRCLITGRRPVPYPVVV